MKNVIITGATGVIGIPLIEELVSRKINVTVICRKNSKRLCDIPKNPRVKIIECSMEDLANYNNVDGSAYDTFIHMAWSGADALTRNNAAVQEQNIEYAIDAVECAVKLGCKKFVGIGSQAEYGRTNEKLTSNTTTKPENFYGFAKLCAGNLTRKYSQKYGLAYNWIRVLSVYGRNTVNETLIGGTINKLLNGETPSFTKLEQKWDFLHSTDAAKAIIAVCEKGKNGKTYVLGSGEEVILSDCVKEISQMINPNIRLGIGEIPYSPNQVMHLCADISELKTDTGWEPEISFAEGIRDLINEKKRQIECTSKKLKKKTT